MARPKSKKSRSNQKTLASAKPSAENSIESATETVSADCDQVRNVQLDCVAELALAAQDTDVPEKVDPRVRSENRPAIEDGEAESYQPAVELGRELLKDRDIESIFNRLNHWLEGESQADTSAQVEPALPVMCERANATAADSSVDDATMLTQDFELRDELSTVTSFSQQLGSSETDERATEGFAKVLSRLDELSLRLESRLEKRLETLEIRIQESLDVFCSGMKTFPQQLRESIAESVNSAMKMLPAQGLTATQSVVPITEESNWDSRKRQMLSQFGLSSDEIDQMVPTKVSQTASPANTNVSALCKAEDQALEALHSSIETLDKIESGFSSTEIEELKEQLTAKLREAEIELSINRAKLSKGWAALEQKTAEVAQREAALKSKYHDLDANNKKGLLDRITRHLSRKS